MNKNERLLVKKLINGDQQAYRELCLLHFDQLLTYALNALKSTPLAESVIEEALIQTWRERQLINPGVSFYSHLFKIVKTCVFNILQSAINDETEEEIWYYLEKSLNKEDQLVHNKEEDPIIKAIQNRMLQQKLVHKLTTTLG